MKLKLRLGFQNLQEFGKNHPRVLFGVPLAICLLPLLTIIICNTLIQDSQRYILGPQNNKHVSVGLVLGAGITKDGKPFRELQARLDSAALALQRGQVNKLILSGDNRFSSYDEPGAMIKYLTQVKHIPADQLQPDYAGRSTYESCERASKIFNLQKTIIFSAGSHLPRAIFLCRHFGVEAYGISSGVEANNSGRREPLARVKAIYNVYVRGEKTILGHSIQLSAQ